MSEGIGIIGLIIFLMSLCQAVTQPGMSADQVTEPAATPMSINVQSLIEQAQNAGCADIMNALYLIDEEVVVWYRSGDCPDSAYAITLYDARTNEVLCTQYDSIAGPRLDCAAEEYRPLFGMLQGGIRPAMNQHTVEELFSEGTGRRGFGN